MDGWGERQRRCAVGGSRPRTFGVAGIAGDGGGQITWREGQLFRRRGERRRSSRGPRRVHLEGCSCRRRGGRSESGHSCVRRFRRSKALDVRLRSSGVDDRRVHVLSGGHRRRRGRGGSVWPGSGRRSFGCGGASFDRTGQHRRRMRVAFGGGLLVRVTAGRCWRLGDYTLNGLLGRRCVQRIGARGNRCRSGTLVQTGGHSCARIRGVRGVLPRGWRSVALGFGGGSLSSRLRGRLCAAQPGSVGLARWRI